MSISGGDNSDIIAAVATPPGRGGVGIVRVSGPSLKGLLETLHPAPISPRQAVLSEFTDGNGETIDQGLLLFFPGPNSYTGEDVIELQGHGGPVVMDTLLQRLLELGARPARPGEFSLRAFINDKLDLAQAEAIADLIDASSREAARSAMRSLQGEFSRLIHGLVERLIELRVYVEAAIDFPDEEIDFLSDGHVAAQLESLIREVETLMNRARQGVILGEGMTVVIAGKPNAGKSSLLNTLSGRDSAIVTEVAGTTRDVLRETINIDGMPLHVVDTAGLRDTGDIVEKEGVRRAWLEIEKADRILFVADITEGTGVDVRDLWPEFFDRYPDRENLTLVYNKIDRLEGTGPADNQSLPTFRLSAVTGQGVDSLRDHLKVCMGYEQSGEGNFMARRRHLESLRQALEKLREAGYQLQTFNAGELVAEDLRYAQQYLGEITGEFSADDLLGRIFSSFCIGK